MTIYLLFALLVSLSGCAANCGHCAVCASPQCSECIPTYYLPSLTGDCTPCGSVACSSGQYYCASACGPGVDAGGGCRACSTCGAGYYQTAACTATTNTVCAACTITVINASPCPADYYWLASACGGTDKGCRACSTVKPCPLGHFWDETKCGVLARHANSDNGCYECTNCVTSDGKRTKAWGICNGVSGIENPETTCLNPGPALCRLCAAYVEEWFYKAPEETWEDCTGEENHDWVFLPGKDEGDLSDACLAAKADEDSDEAGDCYWTLPIVDLPVAAHKSCLYNMVIDAMGIYNTLLGGWPLPVPYPPEPFNTTF